jgi:Cu2+-exporting ATPase
VFTLGFGIGASVVTNNIAALGALANGLLPMRRVAQLEVERRHLLEMELRQSGLLRDVGSQLRSADFSAELERAVSPATSDAATRYPRRAALAAD